MATSKYPLGRYQVIDRELTKKDWVKTKELKKIIEDELSINVSERSINEDLIAMRDDSLLGFYAPIGYNKSQKAYCYTDRNYTIKAFGLRDTDIKALMFYAKTLNQYKEYEIFKDFSSAIEKVIDAVNIRKGIRGTTPTKTIVQTEKTPKLTGSELIPIIVEALDSNKGIEFNYQKFEESKPKLTRLEPYLLKEDRHRWYILGKSEGSKKPTKTYALDRMSEVKLLDKKFSPVQFDFDKYFEHSFGITVTSEKPVDVILSFTPFQGKYVKTLPIHPTQKCLCDNKKEYRISVKVRPTWEFYEKLLGYGSSVKVISPKSTITDLKGIISLISKQYIKK